MTGTADTEAYEFQQIYGLEVVVIPTHRPMVRKDEAGRRVPQAAAEVRRDRRRHQGLLRRAASRCWSAPRRSRCPSCSRTCCKKERVPHEVLNAKQHEREAHIVAQAGRPKAITIATNMAGRGTDIVLGGSLDAELNVLAEDTTDGRARAHQDRMEEAPRGSRRPRRPAHRRHRAPRIAPHRQPAARPFGPPGRSRIEPFLPLARRQPDPHLHGRGRRAPDAHVRHEGRRCDPGSHGQPPDREGAAQGRSAQLRHPQAPARVRRHRERSAQGHLPAAQRTARQRERQRDDRRRASATSSTSWCAASCRPNRSTSSGISPGSRRSSIPSSASSSI